jgi:hypothetical protein
VRFVASRDALRARPSARAPRRWASGAFNFVASNFGTVADLLHLPPAAVVETAPPVMLPDAAPPPAGDKRASAAAAKEERARAGALRLRGARGATLPDARA